MQGTKSVTESAPNQQKELDDGENILGLSENDEELLIQEIDDSYQATVEEINRTCDNYITVIKADRKRYLK